MVDPQNQTDVRPAAAVPTSVYTYYDDRGVLIYVGVTARGVKRNREHNHTKQWWSFVATQSVEHFATRADALARESTLIRTFTPPFNVQQNPMHESVRTSYLAFRSVDQTALAQRDYWSTNLRVITFTLARRDDDGGNTLLRSQQLYPFTSITVPTDFAVRSSYFGKKRIASCAVLGPCLTVTISGKCPPIDSATAHLSWDAAAHAPMFRSLLLTPTVEYIAARVARVEDGRMLRRAVRQGALRPRQLELVTDPTPPQVIRKNTQDGATSTGLHMTEFLAAVKRHGAGAVDALIDRGFNTKQVAQKADKAVRRHYVTADDTVFALTDQGLDVLRTAS